MPLSKWKSLAVFLLIVFTIQLLGYIATGVSTDNWYSELKKPDWAGSQWTFGWVWTFLYFLIAISGWMVYNKVDGDLNSTAMRVYGLQLFCIAIWPWLFFVAHHTLFSFIDIVILFLLILFTMAAFWRHSPWASVLLFPYLLWISFAMSINFVIALYDVIEGAQ